MNICNFVYLVVKFIIYSTIGYYLSHYFFKAKAKKVFFKGIASPYWGIAFLSFLASPCDNILFLFSWGVLSGALIFFVGQTLWREYCAKHNLYIYGLLCIIAVYLIDPLINWFLNGSSFISVIIFFNIFAILYLLDLIYSFRENI